MPEILHFASHVTTQCWWIVAQANNAVEPLSQILPNLVSGPVGLKRKGLYHHICLKRKGIHRFGYGTCLHQFFATQAECTVTFVTRLR